MFCKNCGQEIAAGHKFCAKCGAMNAVNVQEKETATVGQGDGSTAYIQNDAAKESFVPEADAAKIAYTNPTVNPSAEVPYVKVKRNKLGAVSLILSLLLAVFILISSMGTISVLTFRGVFSSKNVSRIVEAIDIEEIMQTDSMDVDGMVTDPIDEEIVEEILSQEWVKDYLVGVMSGYADYIIGGEEPEEIDGEQVVDLIRENKRSVEKIVGFELQDMDYDYVENCIDENKEDINSAFTEIADNEAVQNLRNWASLKVVIIFGAIMLVLLALMFVVRKGSVSSLSWYAAPCIVASVLFLIPVMLSSAMLGIIDENGVSAEIAEVIIKGITGSMLTNSLIMIAVSFLMIIIHIIVSVLAKKRIK